MPRVTPTRTLTLQSPDPEWEPANGTPVIPDLLGCAQAAASLALGETETVARVVVVTASGKRIVVRR